MTDRRGFLAALAAVALAPRALRRLPPPELPIGVYGLQGLKIKPQYVDSVANQWSIKQDFASACFYSPSVGHWREWIDSMRPWWADQRTRLLRENREDRFFYVRPKFLEAWCTRCDARVTCAEPDDVPLHSVPCNCPGGRGWLFKIGGRLVDI